MYNPNIMKQYISLSQKNQPQATDHYGTLNCQAVSLLYFRYHKLGMCDQQKIQD